MTKVRLDENLAIREVLDDIVGMVDRREKLILSASDRAEETRDSGMLDQVRQLEGLMRDFLALFDPVLSKVRAYGESLRGSVTDSEAFLRSLVGIIDAGKAIDGSSATVLELEKNADVVQDELRDASKTLGKIEYLMKRARPYALNKDKASLSGEGPTRAVDPKPDWSLKEHVSRQEWSRKADSRGEDWRSRDTASMQSWSAREHGSRQEWVSRDRAEKEEWSARKDPIPPSETAAGQERSSRVELSDVDRGVEELEDGVSRILREGFLGKENRLSRSDLFGGSRLSPDEASEREN